MISILRTIARDETLLRSLDSILESSILQEQVHGVALDFDRFWLAWTEIEFTARIGHYGYGIPAICGIGYLTLFFSEELEESLLGALQGGRRPTNWAHHCELQGYRNASIVPIIIKIIIKDYDLDTRKYDFPNIIESQFGAHPIVYEYRPPCLAVSSSASLVLAPSTSIGQVNPHRTGTLGGFVKSRNDNKYYAVTCAHVLSPPGAGALHPGPSRGLHGSYIGCVEFSELPPQMFGAEVCNSRSSFTSNSLDVSVISIDPSMALPLPQPGYPSSTMMISQMGTQDVLFDGQVSGPVSAKIDDLNLWRTILIDSQPHCFGDIFSIVPRRTSYLNRALAKPGDSGSWVVLDDPKVPAWAGMVIADDGLKAYCCFAEHIVNRTSSHFGGAGTCVLP